MQKHRGLGAQPLPPFLLLVIPPANLPARLAPAPSHLSVRPSVRPSLPFSFSRNLPAFPVCLAQREARGTEVRNGLPLPPVVLEPLKRKKGQECSVFSRSSEEDPVRTGQDLKAEPAAQPAARASGPQPGLNRHRGGRSLIHSFIHSVNTRGCITRTACRYHVRRWPFRGE